MQTAPAVTDNPHKHGINGLPEIQALLTDGAAWPLAARSANPQLADAQGLTPLAHADRRVQQTIADVLRRAGARP